MDSEAFNDTTEPALSDEPMTKKSKHGSDGDTSESLESCQYEVVLLSSDSDESISDNTSDGSCASTLVQSASKNTVVPVHVSIASCDVSESDQGSSSASPSSLIVTPAETEPVIHLSDDEDDACTITDESSFVPATRASLIRTIPAPSTVNNSCSSLSSLRHPLSAAQMSVKSADVFNPNPLYPVVHETRSVTVTQRCTIGLNGVQTAIYQHAETASSRVCCPLLTHPLTGPFPPNLSVSDVRSLASSSIAPTSRNPAFIRIAQSHLNATSSNGPIPPVHSHPHFDHSGPIILD